MNEIKKLFDKALNGKHWKNLGQFCNRKTHPFKHRLNYRIYRRGKNRCLECGAKIGKIKCIRTSYYEQIGDTISNENPIIKFLKQKGVINGRS